jgi:hypothetical protein
MDPTPSSSAEDSTAAPTTRPAPLAGAGGADRRGRWVAIVTGALSILIGLAYLVLITLLDRQGPLLPPPPEAFGVVAATRPWVSAVVPPPGAGPRPGSGAAPLRAG